MVSKKKVFRRNPSFTSHYKNKETSQAVAQCVVCDYLSQASELRVFISHHLDLILFLFGILSMGNSHFNMYNHNSCSLTTRELQT